MRERHADRVTPESGGGPLRRRRIPAVLVVAVVAALAAGAVLGLSQLHRVAARPASSARSSAAAGGTGATVQVTRDFGASALASGAVDVLAGSGGGAPSVMEALQSVAKVDTAYGGGFVNAVDGLASGYTGGGAEQRDWFYYVNGLLATRGAADYRLRAGDRVWWDFRRWDFAPSVPAVVGLYPEPFVHGADGTRPATRIVFAEGFAPDAENLARALRAAGATDVSTAYLTPSLAPPRGAHLVLVGPSSQLAKVSWVADATAHPAASGLFAGFSAGESRVVGAGGETVVVPPAGAAMATARGDAPGVAIWLVTGAEDSDAHRAAALMVAEPAALAGRFGVLVPRSGAPVALPLEAAR